MNLIANGIINFMDVKSNNNIYYFLIKKIQQKSLSLNTDTKQIIVQINVTNT